MKKTRVLQRNNMSEISKLDQNLVIKKIDKETVNIQITENEVLMSIVGQFDQNLKELSKLTNTNIFLEEILLLVREKMKTLIYFVKL